MENLDDLIKYKELLNNNVITQEEFDKKKTELLNIKKKQKVKDKGRMSISKLFFIIFIGLILLGMIISISFNTNRNTITLIDGQVGEYGVYNRELGYYTYFLPVGKYKIISCKAKEKPAIDLFDAVVWKSDDTSYSLKGKTYRKSASDETIYTTELLDTFTISENEYIYIPLNWTITLEIIK